MLYDDVIASVDFFVRINIMYVHQKINDHLDTICFNGKRDVVGVVVDVVVIHDFLNHYYFQIDFLDLINHKLQKERLTQTMSYRLLRGISRNQLGIWYAIIRKS